MSIGLRDLRQDQDGHSLSVVMPAHNEERTIAQAVDEVLGLSLEHPFELIVVDDGSTDGTAAALAAVDDPRLHVHRHPTNLGKGAAVLSGAGLATGTHFVVFDADREYAAEDLPLLFDPIVRGRADVVYGTRVFGMHTVYQSYRYAIGNRFMTLAANVLFDACLTDLHTCLKMIPLDLFRQLHLTHNGFGLDSEITAELLRRGHRPYEVPVHYMSRSHAQGKKITWRDGVDCLVVLGRVRLRGRQADPLPDVLDRVADAVDEAGVDTDALLDVDALPDGAEVIDLRSEVGLSLLSNRSHTRRRRQRRGA